MEIKCNPYLMKRAHPQPFHLEQEEHDCGRCRHTPTMSSVVLCHATGTRRLSYIIAVGSEPIVLGAHECNHHKAYAMNKQAVVISS